MSNRSRALLLAIPLVVVCGVVCYAATVAQWLSDGHYVSNSAALTAGAGKIPVGDGTGFAECTVSGDGTLASGGAINITGIGHITTGTLGVANGGTGAGTLGTSRQWVLGNGTAAMTAAAAPTTGDTSADTIVGTSAAAKKGLVIQGKSGQTANAFEIQNSSGITQFGISLGSATASGSNNTNLGLNAGTALTSGSNNTFTGVNAGAAVQGGSFNTCYGSFAGGTTLVSGSSNTIIGKASDTNSANTASAIIVGAVTVAESNSVVIANAVTSTTSNDFIIRSGDTGIQRAGAAGVMGITDGSGNILTRFGRLNYQTKSAAYTAVQADGWSHFDVDATGGGNLPLITLPSAATVGAGWTVWISKADTNSTAATIAAPNPFIQYTTNPVPIVCNSADGIDGVPWTQKSLAAAGTFSITSNQVTITTSASHGLVVGSVVTIAAVTNTYLNGTFVVINTPSATTFIYTLTHANVGSTADTGTVTYATTWLTQQHGKIGLMSTGVAGSGAKQGWTVIECSGEGIDSGSSGTINGPTNATGMLISIPLAPGEYDVSANINLILNTTTVSGNFQWFAGLSKDQSTLNMRSQSTQQPAANYQAGVAVAPTKLVVTSPTLVAAAMSTQVVTGGQPQGNAFLVVRRSR